WLEESYPHYDEYKQLISWRSYVVCDVNQADVNNWLRTPFIERGAAERLYIEVKFSMRDCTHFPATVRSCKETFSLLYYESEFDFADEAMPTWNARTYSMVDRIAADEGRFSDNNEVVINTEVRSVAASKRGVYFAFHDEGACISLLAVRVYYVTCPNITLNHAFFPETPTGREVSSIKQTIGGCVPNAAQSRTPSYLCTGGGQWDLLTGGCECVAGYQAIGQQCE
ncbi:PREDICTED: ephrin type-B receptor 3-like, partial [Priapulus caudatus]|uniref:Ephrin type-B receptor 3-like n=1 Tax=Priapulus caudatus TaxID=37621 RepID=A0ABM1F3R1_PRICU